ncbi:XRE family transcriptional regulator [Pseudoalteromonas piscicida]
MEQSLMSLAERVEYAIKPDSIRAFALKIDVSEGTLRRILKGEDPKLSVIERIAKQANVDLMWLVTGIPLDCKTESPIIQQSIILEDFNEDFVVVPGYHVSVSTGYGAFNQSAEVARYLAFRKKWIEFKNLDKSQLVVVFAKGDSMEPTIHNNNTILVDLSDKKLSEASDLCCPPW